MYMDNVLEISVDATKILRSLEGNTLQYKNNMIESPDMYLRANLQEKAINNVNVGRLEASNTYKRPLLR